MSKYLHADAVFLLALIAIILSPRPSSAAKNWVDVPVQSQGADKVAVLPKDLKAGDCWMKHGSRYVFHSDGTGEFFGVTKTDQTSRYDVWHQGSAIKDADGASRPVQFGGDFDSMSMAADRKWHSWDVTFQYEAVLFPKLSTIRWVGDC